MEPINKKPKLRLLVLGDSGLVPSPGSVATPVPLFVSAEVRRIDTL
jgi:hypothetical protein